MNQIQLLKKFSARRKKWRKLDLYPKDSDLQTLRRHEGGCWSLLVIFAASIETTVNCLYSDSLFSKIGAGFVLCFMLYLFYELYRTQKLRALFEWSATQNSDELIATLEKVSPEQGVGDYH